MFALNALQFFTTDQPNTKIPVLHAVEVILVIKDTLKVNLEEVAVFDSIFFFKSRFFYKLSFKLFD